MERPHRGDSGEIFAGRGNGFGGRSIHRPCRNRAAARAARSQRRTSSRGEITATTGLPCSIGVGTSRLIAKVASEQAKPHGLVWVAPGSESEFLAPLPVRRIPGIGKVTEERAEGSRHRNDRAVAGGSARSAGGEFRPVGRARCSARRAESTRMNFSSMRKPNRCRTTKPSARTRTIAQQLESTLSYLCQKASKRVRDAGLHARTVTLTLALLGFPDDSRGATRLPSLPISTMFSCKAVRDLFARAWDGTRKTAAGGRGVFTFRGGARGQLDLLDPGRREKLERLARATDRLRDKFGFSKVQFGGSLQQSRKRRTKSNGLLHRCSVERLPLRSASHRSKLSAHNHAMSARALAEQICRTLRAAGHQAYLVGGCVRDILLGREPVDYDVATDATPDQVQQTFSRQPGRGRAVRRGHCPSRDEAIRSRRRHAGGGGDVPLRRWLFRRAAPGPGDLREVARGRCSAARLHDQRAAARSRDRRSARLRGRTQGS